MEETALEKATRHAMTGARILARHKRLIAELRADGHDTTSAEALLATLIATQRIFEDHMRATLIQSGLGGHTNASIRPVPFRPGQHTYEPRSVKLDRVARAMSAGWMVRAASQHEKMNYSASVMQAVGGLSEAPMASKLELQERQALTEAQRHLDTANHCLVRTMMQTHQLIVEGKQRLKLRQDSGTPKRSRSSNLSKSGPWANMSSDEEATPLLRLKRLKPKSDDNASVLSRYYPGRSWR